MFGRRITLFKLFGFAVHIDASWIIVAMLVAWSLAVGFFPAQFPGLTGRDYWLMAVLGAIGLFASIIVHELSHSLVARRYGLQMKGITLFIFGGVAEMENEPQNARTELMMAAAGPVASIVIGFLFYLAYTAGRDTWSTFTVGIVAYLAWMNWILAAFNLIPAFPLDGGRILRAALWHWKGDLMRATRIAAAFGSGFGLLLIMLAVFTLFSGNFITAMWWFLIGMFVRGASQASYQQVVLKRTLEGESVRRFMKTDPITVSRSISIRELVDEYIYRYHHKMFPVVSESNRLLGCVTTRDVKNVSREEWENHTVQEISSPCSESNVIGPDTDAMKALSLMSRTGNSRLMVVENGELVAIVSLKDLLRFISTKLELEGREPPLKIPAGIGS